MSSNVTDDNTKPAKDLVVRSQAAEIVQTPIDLWSLYLQEANDRAKVKVDLWKGSLKAFLLFAGLFAAVVSPFVIDSQARLQPTPSISTLAINFLWFTSLTLTLISALAAVLAQTWIVKFSLIPAQGFKGAMERWIRDDGAENWHLHTAITWITAFIQLSLFLFLAGFAVQAMVDHRSLGWTILSFVLLTLTLYLGITVLPWLNPTTPFRTPISELSRRNQSILLSEVLGLAPTPKAKNRGMWKFIQSIWTNLRRVLLSEILGLAPTSKAENRVVLGLAPTTKAKNRGVWKAIQSIWTNLRKTPDQAEVRLGICWSTLKDSSNNICIHAAVQELTKERINENQSKRLIELGLPEELSFRLAHPPAGLETTVSVVQRMKSYLHVIMWMVDECESDVARRFSLLIEPTDALLLALDALPSECRSLAFAIRVNLLLSNCEHGKIHGTEWTAMVDGLESNFAFDVCRTAFRGLVIAKDRVTKDFSHTRQDCARMLAAYIGSTRFSNEKLANSRITGDPLRIPRAQQDPIGHVKAFFSQLQEAWKRSMCTRAIRLMEDVHVDQQIMGFQGLSSVAENEAFREAVNDVLPELGSTLKKVDWRTSVACLRRVSQILEQDSRGSSIFRDAIKAILPEIIGLLSHSAQVRHAVLELAYQMDTEAWVIDEMKRITQDLVAALLSPDWLTRFASLQSLAELIEMDKIRPAIIGQEQNVIDCISFPDEDVRLAAIGTLRELAKHEEFYDAIQANMSDILGLVSDENTTVRAAAIGFVSEVSGSDSLRIAINRNIRGLMTVNFKSDLWVIRQGSLQFLAELLKSGDSYDVGIRYAFHDILNCLRDPDEDVGQAALRVISLAAVKSSFSDNIKTAIPSIWAMFFDTNEDVRVAALTAYSDIVKIQQKSLEKTFSDAIPAVLSALDHSGRTQIAALGTLTVLAAAADLTGTMPTIAKLFKADETDVRVAALTTCSDIAKIQAGTLQNTVKDIMPGILVAIESPSGWRTQVAALKTISTFAEIDDSIQTLNDNALDKVAAALSDYDDDVRFQALDTLAVLESKNRFRNKIKKAAVGNILPLLEDWRWKVRGKTLDTLAVFAKHGVFLASDEEIVAHIISTLSDGDTDTSRRVLKILFNVENRDAGAEVSPEINLEMLVATNSLSHPNWHVRVAGLQVLESFTDDTNHKRSSFPGVDTIVQSLSDEVEEVKLAGLRTWFKLIEHEFFGDRSNAFDTVPAVISSLLRSDSEDIRISVTDVISTYINKETFHSVIEGLIPTIVNLLVDVDKDSREDSRDGSRVAMLKIVRGLAGTEKFCTNEIFVKDVIRRILPSLLSERAVRLAALQIVPVISKHAVFNKIVADSLQTLLKTTARSEEEEEADTPKEVDDKFQAEVLQTLSHLATNESFRGKIDTKSAESYALATKDGSLPTRVASLKLMSVLGVSARDSFKSTVKQMMPDISDALHDSEHIEMRMAGVELLTISVIKEISPTEFNSLLPTLVALLSDSEEDVRILVLQTLSDLIKQDVFREAINGTIPSFLNALRHSEANTRVAALKTCATLAQDVTLRDIVTRAAPQITACVTDPDDGVSVVAMITLGQLSQYDAFRLTIAGAASQVMSQLNSLDWGIRLQALRTLSAFAENDAFGDMISSFLQRIVECMKDDDDDVRVQVSKTLLSLVEHSAYRPSIRGALQDCGKSHVVDLASGPLKHVRMAALPLIQKVVELDAFPDSVQEIMATIVNHLSDGDDAQCIVVLETIRAVINAATYAKELTTHIDKLIGLLKHDGSNSTIPTTVLSTLSVLVRQDTESVDIVVQTMTTVFSDFEETAEPQFWDAATEVLLALADLGTGLDDKARNFVSSSVTSALTHSNWRARLLGLSVLGSLDREVFPFQFQTARPVVIKLVESADLDVRLSTIRVAGPLIDELDLDEEHMEIFRAAMQQSWRDIVVDMKSPNPSAVGFERLSELSDNDFFDGQFTDLIPLIVTALKGQHQPATWLHLLSKLAAARASYDFNLRNALVQVVPGMIAFLSNRKTDTQIRLEVLENLREFTEYRKLRAKIQEHVSVIILALKDRDSKVRVASLRVLLKLVQAASPGNIPDRIKSTMPTLLTLIQDLTTREDTVALITCLAADKTLRSDLLAKLLPATLTSNSSRSPISWGRLLLTARLLEDERLELEESDLRFILRLVTSQNPEVQDFVLKFMTSRLQQYLETWRNATAEKFPHSLLSAFSSIALVKR